MSGDTAQELQAQLPDSQFRDPAIHVFRQHQAIGPIDKLPAHLQGEFVLNGLAFIGRDTALQVEAVIGLFHRWSDRLIAFAVEAVVVVEIAIGGACGEKTRGRCRCSAA